MRIAITLLIGLIVGALVSIKLPERDLQWVVITIVVGVSGSVLGAALCPPFGIRASDGGGVGIVASILGAGLVSAIYFALFQRARTS